MENGLLAIGAGLAVLTGMGARETSADGEQTVFHIVSTSKCLFVAYSMASDT